MDARDELVLSHDAGRRSGSYFGPLSMPNPVADAKAPKKQECTVQSLYFSGATLLVVYPIGLAVFAVNGSWVLFALWLLLVPGLKWGYVRFFPRLSKWKGYGSVEDQLPAVVSKTRVEVTAYSVLGCPFCPIVERRLDALQKEMDFSLTKIDLTLKPLLSATKMIRSVPVVEVGNDRLIGNATTQQLAQLIARAQASGPSGPPTAIQ
jgi:glutaredoxin